MTEIEATQAGLSLRSSRLCVKIGCRFGCGSAAPRLCGSMEPGSSAWLRLSPNPLKRAAVLAVGLFCLALSATAFEGRIQAVTVQGGQSLPLLYTFATNLLRIEVTDTNRPNAVNILALESGAMTLLFPHNRSFVRLPPHKSDDVPARGATSDLPAMPNRPPPPAGLPPGISPQPQAAGAAMSAPPMMPMPREALELKATGQKTNLLGYACEQFEVKQRGEVLEIWATSALPAFYGYQRNQPHRFGPDMIEERWAGLLTARKLFPLRASLRFENGQERFRFEVLAVTPQKLKPEDARLFLPPADYFETRPLPF